jgi:hypothetical protein
MVKWANDEFPALSLDDIRRETRAFMNHRYPGGRIEWTGAWENWVKGAIERREARAKAPSPAFQSARAQRMAEAAPGLAARPARIPGQIIEMEAADADHRPVALRGS